MAVAKMAKLQLVQLGGAIGSTFGEMFASMFRPSAEKEAEIDRACARRVNVPRSACA